MRRHDSKTDRKRIVLIAVAVGTAAGAVVAWFGRQFWQLHDPGLSNHAHKEQR